MGTPVNISSPFTILEGNIPNMTTFKTSFTRTEEAINFTDATPLSVTLIGQFPYKPTPSSVLYRLCKTMISGHSFNVQVFKSDCLIFINQTCRQFMRKVFSLARNSFMDQGNSVQCLISILSAFCASGQYPLRPFQFLFRLTKELGWRYCEPSDVTRKDLRPRSIPIAPPSVLGFSHPLRD